MAPQRDGRKEGERLPSLSWPPATTEHDDFDSDDDLPSLVLSSVFAVVPMAVSATVTTHISAEPTSAYSKASTTRKGPPGLPDNQHTGLPLGPRPDIWKTSSWSPESLSTLPADEASTTTPDSLVPFESYQQTLLSTATVDGYGDGPPDRPWVHRHSNNAPIYIAASIIPLVVLVIIGAMIWVCLRRRKQRENMKAALASQETKMEPKPITLPYVAPPVNRPAQVAARQLPPTCTPSQVQPVIRGPILSSSNGAYMTGIDTSDVVSISPDNPRHADRSTDNSSLMEPPPPYRPSSVAPPSFVSTSRQSSLRAHGHPPATSGTHLMERSPFEDPPDDVSELSEPTQGRGDDGLSMVSDMSYQCDPVVHRSAL